MRRGLLLLSDDTDGLIDTAAMLGFDGVEIAMGNGIDTLDRSKVSAWKERCNGLGLYMAAHAPSLDLRLDSANDGIRRESIRQIEICLDAFSGAIDYLTIHTGFVRRYAKLGSLERTIIALRDIATTAARHEITICVENVFEGSIDEMLNYFDLAHRSNLRMTFDVAHAAVYGGFDPTIAVPVIGDLILNVHLSDNDGQSDQHMALGAGVMPVGEVISQLKRASYTGYATIEARNPSEAETSLSRLDGLIAA